MNYLEGLRIIKETTTSYGGVWGSSNVGIGTHGGDFGNGDWYAKGNAQNPLGLDITKVSKKGKKGKKKKKKTKVLMYRRSFLESAMIPEELLLDCFIYVTPKYREIVERVCKNNEVTASTVSGSLHLTTEDSKIRGIMDDLYSLLGEEIFTENILSLIGESQ
jgi:hypothetical protein